MAEIAIIGGSGVYSLDNIENPEKRSLETPYGDSPEIVLGNMKGRKIAFMPRHGREHSAPPHKINYRANLWALNELGVKRILATTAVGSLNEEIKPGEFVLLDQFIDFTKSRPSTFYEGKSEGVVHVDMTEPYCPELREVLIDTADQIKTTLHPAGTYVCMEGPRFETAAEIKMLKKLGADVVGMTNVPESVLARELEICYSTVSVVTNFGAGISKGKLTHKEVAEVMNKNIKRVKELFSYSIPNIPKKRGCPCKGALEGSKVRI